MGDQIFKKCNGCSEVWITQEQFISDKQLGLNGYKANFEKLESGLYFFTHRKPGCYSTMALEVNNFLNLYTGPIYLERKTGSEECPKYCLDKYQLDRCDVSCECAFIREIIQIIKSRKKQPLSPAGSRRGQG